MKTFADNEVLVHCLYVRKLLDLDVLKAIVWLDTHDMAADVLTNGAVDRLAIHDLVSGSIRAQ